MKIGYPCINRSMVCTPNSTFRLSSYTDNFFRDKVSQNLFCLKEILLWNIKNGLLFFRIGSSLIPFASHPICKVDWKQEFKEELVELGNIIKDNDIRISMHPDQFTLINSPDNSIKYRSIAELEYHCSVLETMELDDTSKVQIHVGGIYGDKELSISRFIENYKNLPAEIKGRLVIENDDRLYRLSDCIMISKKVDVPVLFDNLHHECINNNEPIREAILESASTWNKKDGVMMVDYSQQAIGEKKGKHIQHIEIKKFKEFINIVKDTDMDIMLEIKDKEKSALAAIDVLKKINIA